MKIYYYILLLSISLSVIVAAPTTNSFHHHHHHLNNSNSKSTSTENIPKIVKRITNTTSKSQALNRSTSSINLSTGKAGLDRISPGLDVIRYEIINLINDLNHFEPIQDDVIAWTILNHLNKLTIANENLLETLIVNNKLVKKLGWNIETFKTLKNLDFTWKNFFQSLTTILPNHIEHLELIEFRSMNILDKALRTFY